MATNCPRVFIYDLPSPLQDLGLNVSKLTVEGVFGQMLTRQVPTHMQKSVKRGWFRVRPCS